MSGLSVKMKIVKLIRKRVMVVVVVGMLVVTVVVVIVVRVVLMVILIKLAMVLEGMIITIFKYQSFPHS